MTENEFKVLKNGVETLARTKEQDKGALREFRKRIQKSFGKRVTPKEAKRLLAKLKEEFQTVDAEIEDAFVRFKERWMDEIAKLESKAG